MPLALRYEGHSCRPDSAIKPWYFAGTLCLEEGQTFVVPEKGLLLGRSRAADLRVASNGVARLHALVRPIEDGRALNAKDLGSTNGTTSSRGEGREHRLEAGDTLTLAGVFHFAVVEVASPELGGGGDGA